MSVISIAGGAQAYSLASGGKLYKFNNIGSTFPAGYVNVAPANPSRRSIIFHNPGTEDIIVFPDYVNNSGSTFNQHISSAVDQTAPDNRGGGFLVFANGGTLTLTGECQDAWNAVAVDGSDNPLTVMESNI